MARYWLPLTYTPKIEGVKEGSIRQTIRAGRKYKIGDEIGFHGWEGNPYRSRWSFRVGPFPLNVAMNITLFPDGIRFSFGKYPWESCFCDLVARADGIPSRSGKELAQVMTEYHDIPETGLPAQILRW